MFLPVDRFFTRKPVFSVPGAKRFVVEKFCWGGQVKVSGENEADSGNRLGEDGSSTAFRWRAIHPSLILEHVTTIINKTKTRPMVSLSLLESVCDVDRDALLVSIIWPARKKILFRDLKPAYVGFDSSGVSKLSTLALPFTWNHLTRLRNAATTARSRIYSRLVQHSPIHGTRICIRNGLWEICALKKPFDDVKSSDEFHKAFFVKGARPNWGSICLLFLGISQPAVGWVLPRIGLQCHT